MSAATISLVALKEGTTSVHLYDRFRGLPLLEPSQLQLPHSHHPSQASLTCSEIICSSRLTSHIQTRPFRLSGSANTLPAKDATLAGSINIDVSLSPIRHMLFYPCGFRIEARQ